MPGLMLLDTPSLYYRAFYGIPESMTSPDGMPVNAVRGVIDMIAMLVRRHSPRELVACMDADWRPAFRVAAIPTYKTHRVAEGGAEETPDTLAPQVPVIERVLDAVGIARIGVPGYEADDVMGTLTARAGGQVDVVTGDRDLFQLVDDSRPVRVLYTARGVKNLQLVDETVVAEKYRIPGRCYADFATLRGDPSDGLPGVPGVGDKTAAALITRFGSLEALLRAFDGDGDLTSGQRARLSAARDYLRVAPEVVWVARDVPLPETDLTLPAKPRDPEALAALSERYGLGGPLERLTSAL
ncbi:5'-3' exonuclease [Streptosporangium sp. NBC_01755]|uniref:5'-3' exonuclease n=1 Tax=unclassified Streptosporangium TaxID=2632669 RepID=UPI002DDAAA8C|nr:MULTISPECIES: 5'-3' exonuclease [unclassified Streptosporangium]WSA29063.1 5'-3' exonuclease [Streptosporangium sp. NBC_01810]WSC99490.1 5'-3' exonuclease [Streptosporangium sp. NBC_01755]